MRNNDENSGSSFFRVVNVFAPHHQHCVRISVYTSGDEDGDENIITMHGTKTGPLNVATRISKQTCLIN